MYISFFSFSQQYLSSLFLSQPHKYSFFFFYLFRRTIPLFLFHCNLFLSLVYLSVHFCSFCNLRRSFCNLRYLLIPKNIFQYVLYTLLGNSTKYNFSLYKVCFFNCNQICYIICYNFLFIIFLSYYIKIISIK